MKVRFGLFLGVGFGLFLGIMLFSIGCSEPGQDEKHTFGQYQAPVNNPDIRNVTQQRICSDCGIAEIKEIYRY